MHDHVIGPFFVCWTHYHCKHLPGLFVFPQTGGTEQGQRLLQQDSAQTHFSCVERNALKIKFLNS